MTTLLVTSADIRLATVAFVIIALVCLSAMLLEFKRVLMMMQQNSYRPERYMKWLSTSGDSTSIVRLLGICAFFFALAMFTGITLGTAALLIFAVYCIVKLVRVKYKKPLVWTPRARRIYGVMCCEAIVVIALILLLFYYPSVARMAYLTAITAIGLYCVSHAVVIGAIYILDPVERRINKKYYNEAADILASMPSLKVIGITGSYGKTSTKHYLNRILNEQFNVLMTPGSYNTTMGVIRTVREMMQPYTEIFICEMGAKNIGDIKEICDLVHPSIGIVTAVGEQHLESFRTIENVQRTKFELVDALPADGVAFVNNDFPFVANREVRNVECHRYMIGGNAEYRVSRMDFSEDGTAFTLVTPKGNYDFTTRLIGEFNISNLIPAIAVAMYLGMPVEKIRYAVSRIEQVEHRLSLRRIPGSYTIIDDAFNSNPDGSRMALDVLAAMKRGKRYVITPGMIELGDKQWEYNKRFGKKIALSVDVAIIVGEYNRDAILEGIREGGLAEECVYTVNTFTEANALLNTMAHQGDAVLLENDLPDTFK